MIRARMKITIDAPPGGSAERAFESLREMGYTVDVAQTYSIPGFQRRYVADVQTPHGEVVGRRFVGKERRRG